MAKPGINLRAIASEVGCSIGTACRDVQAVRAEWAARRAELYESKAAEDLSRTDAAIAALWPRVQAGDRSAIDTMIRVLERRAKLLGLDAPSQLQADVIVRQYVGVDVDEV